MAPPKKVDLPGTLHLCGLRKTGPNLYAVVTGTVVDGVPALVVDPVSESLDHAAELLRAKYQLLMEQIP